jgi:bifunctional UDP-N-acetylglucosamine pyrophosphorylase/glucosamine-1-phosphate N-acetyltransferase
VIWAAEVVPRGLNWALPDVRVSLRKEDLVALVDAEGTMIAVVGPRDVALGAFQGDRLEDMQKISCNDLVTLEWWHDIQVAEERLRESMLSQLMSEGVYIQRPALVSVGLHCRLEPGAALLGSVTILGRSSIGADTVIEGPSNLRDVKVGRRVHIRSSEMEAVGISDMSSVGPYAVLRPGTEVGQDTRLGSFVEISNAQVGDTTDIRHLAYIGDAAVGDRVNVGAGVVVAQFDGLRRYRSRISDDAFIGANSTIIGGATVGKRSYVGAGAEVTTDVEDGALYLRRAESASRAGWVDRREAAVAERSALESAVGE